MCIHGNDWLDHAYWYSLFSLWINRVHVAWNIWSNVVHYIIYYREYTTMTDKWTSILLPHYKSNKSNIHPRFIFVMHNAIDKLGWQFEELSLRNFFCDLFSFNLEVTCVNAYEIIVHVNGISSSYWKLVVICCKILYSILIKW